MPHELTKNFPTLLFNFLKAFKAWTMPDEIKLTHRIKHAPIALYQSLISLRIRGFNSIISRLRSKLQQMAGISIYITSWAYEQSAAGPRTASGSPFPA